MAKIEASAGDHFSRDRPWTPAVGAMRPAVKHQLLEQLGEQRKAGAIAEMWTKLGISAALLILGLAELRAGVTESGTGPSCELPLHRWLVGDGAVTSVGMLLGLTATLKGMQIARGVGAQQWVLADGEERPTSGDLTGPFSVVRRLSDWADMVMVLSFFCGCHCFYKSGGGGGCGTMRSWVWWGLALKLLAPIGVSLAIKAFFFLQGASPGPATGTVSVEGRKKEG